MRRLTKAGLPVLAVILLAASCTGGDDETAITSAPTTPPTTIPSTTPTTASTTTAPTTTIDEIAAAEAAAAEAVLAESRAWLDCVADPQVCDPEETFLMYSGGRSADVLLAAFEDWKANGWASRPPLDPAHSSKEIIDTVVVDDPPSEVQVVVCTIDGSLLVDPGAAPDGSDVIINDDISSTLAALSVLLSDDGRWRVHDRQILSQREGAEGCE